jgi:hypothetical protein
MIEKERREQWQEANTFELVMSVENGNMVDGFLYSFWLVYVFLYAYLVVNISKCPLNTWVRGICCVPGGYGHSAYHGSSRILLIGTSFFFESSWASFFYFAPGII